MASVWTVVQGLAIADHVCVYVIQIYRYGDIDID